MRGAGMAVFLDDDDAIVQGGGQEVPRIQIATMPTIWGTR